MKIKRRGPERDVADERAHFIRFTAARGNAPFVIDLRTCPQRIAAYSHWDPETGLCLCGDLVAKGIVSNSEAQRQFAEASGLPVEEDA